MKLHYGLHSLSKLFTRDFGFKQSNIGLGLYQEAYILSTDCTFKRKIYFCDIICYLLFLLLLLGFMFSEILAIFFSLSLSLSQCISIRQKRNCETQIHSAVLRIVITTKRNT